MYENLVGVTSAIGELQHTELLKTKMGNKTGFVRPGHI